MHLTGQKNLQLREKTEFTRRYDTFNVQNLAYKVYLCIN